MKTLQNELSRMAVYNSVNDFIKSLSKDIDNVITNEVSDYVTDAAVAHAEGTVYKRYKIHYRRGNGKAGHYVRRFSLLDKDEWKTKLVNRMGGFDHTVAIYSTAKPNLMLNDFGDLVFQTPYSLPELIELGERKYTARFGGIGYTINGLPVKRYRYLQARPFAVDTVKQLNSSSVLRDIFERSLYEKGYRFT